MFYSLAAEAHPGQDGAPRKAILRYQDPVHPYSYAAESSAVPLYHDDPVGSTYYEYPSYDSQLHPYSYPPTTYDHSSYDAEPAQFANAGPPGYSYNPSSSSWEPATNRWSTASDADFYTNANIIAPPAWRTRSEWSSPMPVQGAWQPPI